MIKQCTKCKETKAFDNFHQNKKGDKFGLHSHCKECRRLDRRLSYIKYSDKYAEWNSRWNMNNPEKRKEYDINRDKNKRYRKHREWILSHPEKKSMYDKKYKHSKSTNGGVLDRYTQELLFMIFGNICCKCKSKTNITIDHIKPVSKGGSNFIYNLQLLCRSCNSSKGNRIIIDYRIWKMPKEQENLLHRI